MSEILSNNMSGVKTKTNPVPTQHAPIGTIESNHPFEKLSWDIMGPLPAAASGCRYVLVVTSVYQMG